MTPINVNKKHNNTLDSVYTTAKNHSVCSISVIVSSEKVENVVYLDLLYILTVADITATNPEL